MSGLTIFTVAWYVMAASLAGGAAAEKGRSFIAYWLLGILFSPLLALLVVIAIPPLDGKQTD